MSDVETEAKPAPSPAPPSLFQDAMRIVGEEISPRTLAHMWTVHVIHGDENCPARSQGEKCCVDVLLESSSPGNLPPLTKEDGGIADIIAAGYDVQIETGDNGEIVVFLMFEDQIDMHSLKYSAKPAALAVAIAQAREFAVTFPKERTQ